MTNLDYKKAEAGIFHVEGIDGLSELEGGLCLMWKESSDEKSILSVRDDLVRDGILSEDDRFSSDDERLPDGYVDFTAPGDRLSWVVVPMTEQGKALAKGKVIKFGCSCCEPDGHDDDLPEQEGYTLARRVVN